METEVGDGEVRRSSTYSKNVYSSSSGEIHKQRLFDRRAISNSAHHSVKDTGTGLEILLDKDASDFEEVVVRRGAIIPPDEVLGATNPGRVKIPIKHRNEFANHNQLPSSDLLQVIHYFTSKKLSTASVDSRHIRKMDETSLLALGLLVESWIDEVVDDGTAKMFLRFKDDVKSDAKVNNFLSPMTATTTAHESHNDDDSEEEMSAGDSESS